MMDDITYIGIDPGVGGAVSMILPDGRLILKKELAEVNLMAVIIFAGMDAAPRGEVRTVLEKVGSFGMEGRATLSTFMVNFGQWQGILESATNIFPGFKWCLATPQAWQKRYRDRLIPGPKKPGAAQAESVHAYRRAIKSWRRAVSKAQGARKKELAIIAIERGAPKKLITQKTADSYLIALHGRDEIEW